MAPRTRKSLLALLSLLATLTPSAVARAQCPKSSVLVGVMSEQPTSPTFSHPDNTSWTMSQGCDIACYDLPHGYLFVRSMPGEGSGHTGHVYLTASDSYTVEGLPPGTACTLTAVLQVAPAIGDSEYVGGAILEPASGATQWFLELLHAPGEPHVVSIQLPETAGVPFVLAFDLQAGGEPFSYVQSSIEGAIRFGGLPAGAWVTSCQNYQVPVPAHSASWGSVKATYR